ncbi:PA-phosphatase [Aquiflexum sp.]|uniref:PA-phosphatase n=1 Tax=Aquiflexum sp. TaxID=1872584 RepID=UPI003593C227
MIRKIALISSFALQPLIVPSLIFLFLLFYAPQATSMGSWEKGYVLLMVFLTTFTIPVLSIFTLKLTKNISSLQMKNKEERLFPFSIVSLYYVMSTYFFQIKFNLEPLLIQTLVSITICVILLTGITFFWKISAHMVAISGLLAIIIAVVTQFPGNDLLYLIMGGILITGGLASSRLYLDAHTPLEVLGGILLGFGVCFFSFRYFT